MRRPHRLRRMTSHLVLLTALLATTLVAPADARDPSDAQGHGFLREQKTTAVVTATAVPASGFTDGVVVSGLSNPTAVRFAADGRVVVAEKDGTLLVFPSLASASPVVAANLATSVHNFWDRGLLGLALDPAFTSNGYVYVLYTYDHVLGSGASAPRWGDTCPTPPGATTDGCVASARLSRLSLVNNVATSELVLIEDWCQQFPSHSIGSLAFGPDGYLYASAGDGASFNNADWGQYGGTLAGTPTLVNPCGDPPGSAGVANSSPSGRGGALRSQSIRRPAGEPVTLDGAIIRVDPNTGAAAPGNPLASSGNTNSARIVGHGLRNPFRFTFRPGTSELWIGDVGWNTWEEIDRLAAPASSPVENFGWPCYEGSAQQSGYSGLTLCVGLYAETSNPAVGPWYAYNHGSSVVTGDNCPTANGSAITGMAFYQGGSYPPRYSDALFFADHSRDCIWAMLPGTNGLPDPTKRELLVGAAGNPVDLQIGPGGDLFYVDLEGGAVHRLTYSAVNTPPVAVFTATPSNGVAPLAVSFSAGASYDPDPADTITYGWDFTDDGVIDATTASATHTYATPGAYTARLTVTDSRGASSSTTRTITANNSAPSPTIGAPTAAFHWAVGDSVAFSGSATDVQDGSMPTSALSWTLTLYHCTTPTTCHSHLVETRAGVGSGTFAAPDHDYPSYLEIALTATDSGGLATTTVVRIDPKTVDLTFQTTPNGLALAINGVASQGTTGTPTITRTVIVNAQNSVSAASPQVLNGIEYRFVSWSDGSTSPDKTVVAPATAWASPLRATFVANSADLSITKSGVLGANASSIGWTLTVRNAAGGLAASSVTVNDTLPTNLGAPGAFDAPGWTCTYSAGTRALTCTLGSMAAGDNSQIRFTTPVVARKANRADNTARLTSATRDVSSGNDSSTMSIRLR